MRVAYDLTPGRVSPAGVGRYARAVAAALPSVPGLDVQVIAAAAHAPRGRVERVLQGLAREGVYYPFTLRRRARRGGADLVHCPAPFAVRSGRLPLVVTVHDMLPFRRPELFPRVIAGQRWSMAATLRRADRLVAVSVFTRDEVVDLLGIPSERIDVVPLGVEERFRPLAPDREWLRRRFGIADRYVACVGTLEPRKNLRMALAAFAAAVRTTGPCELVVAGGTGWRNSEFEAALARTPAPVRLTGYVSDDDLVRLYSGAACFLFPTLGEGFGLPVLEAMACGTPVVTSDATSLPEVAGDAALLVDPTDPGAVAAALTSVLEDGALAHDLRERGLRRARRFTWADCAQGTAEAYRAALA